MTTIAVCSLAGAPGVTTVALALASTWPTEERVCLVEADASGGDIASWWRVPTWPGTVDLAAASRGGQDHEDTGLETYTQVLPGGMRVCVAPATAERTHHAVALLAHHPKALAPSQGVSVLDLGRIAPDSESLRLLGEADLVVAVTTPELGQLKRLKDSMVMLRASSAHLGIVVAGASSRRSGEISQALDAPIWARVPHDRRAAAFLAGQEQLPRVHRRPLIRAAHTLARTLRAHSRPLQVGAGLEGP